MRSLLTVDLGAICRNYARVRDLVPTSCSVAPVLKADAYGHGAEQIARALAAVAKPMFCVALVDEAVRLRDAGIDQPILLLFEPETQDLDSALLHGADIAVSSLAKLADVSRAARRVSRRAGVHLRFDTGLGFAGLDPDEAPEALGKVLGEPTLELNGLFTHLADPMDTERTTAQLQAFSAVHANVPWTSARRPVLHAAGSAAALVCPRAHYDLVRPGTLLYAPFAGLDMRGSQVFESALQWTTRIVDLRTFESGTLVGYGARYKTQGRTCVATISVGYADGFMNGASQSRDVLIRGRRVPVVGRTAMDVSLVDVTSVPDASIGDEVTLLGRQGAVEILASEVARSLGIPTPQLWCGLSKRVSRTYIGMPEAG